MKNCCDKNLEKLCGELDCKTTETADGVKVEITAKDPKKTGSLKALVKACKEFCCC
ncbi:MAG: hypothetical protein M0011_01455 [Elusimicrobia bacterium]|nr:hypothetical protein [Elusimicrobiota bacterium]